MSIDFIKRIDDSLDKLSKKRAEMLRDLNLPRSAISNWYERGNIPAGDICAKIADYLHVDTHWLITGIKAGNLTFEEMDLIRKWRVLKDVQKAPIKILIDNYYKEFLSKVEQAKAEGFKIV